MSLIDQTNEKNGYRTNLVDLANFNYLVLQTGYTTRLVDPERLKDFYEKCVNDIDDVEGVDFIDMMKKLGVIAITEDSFEDSGRKRFIIGDIDGDESLHIDEIHNILEQEGEEFCRGYILLRCQNMRQALDLHQKFELIEHCAFLKNISDIESYRLKNEKTFIVFSYDTESG